MADPNEYEALTRDVPGTSASRDVDVRRVTGRLLKPADDQAILTVEQIESKKAQALLLEMATLNKSLEGDISLRHLFAKVLLWFLVGISISQYGLLACVGAGWLNFRPYPTLLHFVVVENFAQIIGIVVIVVKYLFPVGADGRLLPKIKKADTAEATPKPPKKPKAIKGTNAGSQNLPE